MNLDALGDALEGVVGGTATADQNISGDRQGEEARQRNPYGVNGGKISHKSMKSQPGAMKKREKVAAMERERFARNLAEMMAGGEQRGGGGVVQDGEGGEGGGERGMMVVDSEGGGEAGGGGINESMKGPGSGGSTSKERWAAIRGFIGQTMERRGGGEGRV